MHKPVLAWLSVLSLTVVAATGCSASQGGQSSPTLAPRGKTMTSVKPARQSLTNEVSLAGKVTMNPVFGLVSPVNGQVRYVDITPQQGTPSKPTRVAAVWSGGRPTTVDVPGGSTFAGRLVDDRSTVTSGMPIASAKYAGYGIVADIDGAQAYRISGAVSSVQAQIKDGPGPFPCRVLGTIAALPAGSIPDPPTPTPTPTSGPAQPGQPGQPGPTPTMPVHGPATPGQDKGNGGGAKPSEPTGLRLVCTAPGDVRMINGASVDLSVVTDRVDSALVLPVEAVAGSQGQGKVDVVDAEGRRQTKDVVLGLTDGKVVEIRSGLGPDEPVAVPGPNLPAPSTGASSGPGSTGGR